MINRFENIPERALEWHRAGVGAVLATVVETWGSAPRRVGSQLAISGTGDMAGSVSGGCVEGAVVVEAQEALQTGQARLLEYGVSDDNAFAVGLACGGTIRILVEPVGTAIPEALLADLVAARHARRPIAYVVNTTTQSGALTDQGYADRFRMDRSGFEDDGEVFVAIHNPPLRLMIVGAVHIAQALAPMARIAGYDVTVIDPRSAFATQDRFPDTTLVNEWPDEALASLDINTRTALVLLSHDPKLDDPALELALNAAPFYIGGLGSKRTHAKRIERMVARGFTKGDLRRIHGPVGLDIAASGPAEIAVAILAEMTAVLRGKSRGDRDLTKS